MNLDTFDIIGRMADHVPVEVVRGWVESVPPVMVRGPVDPPPTFPLSPAVKAAIGRLSEKRSLKEELAAAASSPAQAELLRAVYLLWRCGFVPDGRPRPRTS